MWLIPFGYKDERSPHYNDLIRVAEAATFALNSVHKTEYKVGVSKTMIYPVHGCSVDWAHEVLGIKYTYSLELRPHFVEKEYPQGFLLPVEEIGNTLEETWIGLLGMTKAISKNSSSRISMSHFLLMILFVSLILVENIFIVSLLT